MSEHPSPAVLDRYAIGSLAPAAAASVELHSQTCVACRSLVSGRADGARLADNWDLVIAELATPEPSLPERGLRRLGIPGDTVRLLLATPSLRRSWFLAIAAVVVFALIAASPQRPDGGDLGLFLLLAPLLPVAGVALAYGPGVDPSYEVMVATPISGFRLVLTRAVAVLCITLLAGGGTALLLVGRQGAIVAAWLLPALALSAACLALATALRPRLAGGLVGGCWVLAVLLTGSFTGDALAAFGPTGQVVAAVVAVVAGAAFVARRGTLDAWRGPA